MIRMTVADYLRLVAGSMSQPSVQEALETLRKTPGWEQQAKIWFKQQQQKQSGLGKGLAIPLTVALLTLSQALHAQTADDFISKVETKLEQAAPSKATQVDTITRLLPYSMNKVEQGALWAKTLSFPLFKSSLQGKIENGIKQILPKIRKDPSFVGVNDTALADIIIEAFIRKINAPENAKDKKLVSNYLKVKDQGEPIKVLADIAKMTVLPALQAASLDKGRDKH